MIRLLAASVLAIAPLAAGAQSAPPVLDIDQRLLLRCSATFALVADRQQRGEAWARAFPPMAERGREFFVRASAQVMDETGLDRAAVGRLLAAEAEQLVAYDQIAAMMPVCLPYLDPEPQD